jgi:Ran GTPase-activating protein (RanGAP) involved in mRNA processing and transport
MGLKELTGLANSMKTFKFLNTLLLNLKDNELGEEGLRALAILLPDLSNLTSLSLNLWGCGLHE